MLSLKNGSKFIAAFAITLLISGVFSRLTNGQNDSTLGDFDQNNQTQKQKAPNRLLAKNFAQDKKTSAETNSSKEQAEKNQKKDGTKKSDNKTNDKKPATPLVSPKRRNELMKFVELHHKELKPLLNQLKKHNNAQYQAALRTLDRNEKNLQTLKSKKGASSKSRYDRALNNWILSSKVQLLTAHLALKKSRKEQAAMLNKIRPLLEKQLDIRKEQLQADLASAKAKQERLQKDLDKLNASDSVEKKMAIVEKTSQKIANQYKKRRDKEQANVKEKKPTQGKKQNNN